LHADVWRRGSLSAFYVRDRPADFGPSVRMAYVFDKGGWEGGGPVRPQRAGVRVLRSLRARKAPTTR